jgi:hypothetical protein
MDNFIAGLFLGSLLTAAVAGAGTFYNKEGQPNAPTGSVQQFDYFRQRQLFLDAGAIRRNQEEQMRNDRMNPCAK